jgi:hypothetical protein
MPARLEMEFDQQSVAELHRKLAADYLIDVPFEAFADSLAIVIGKAAKAKTPVDRGDLQRGIKVLKEKGGVAVVASAPHSIYVHEGTRPHWPPIDALRGWAARHGISPYLVALSISRKGTKAVPFLKDAAEEQFAKLNPGMTTLTAGIEKRWSA